MTPLVVLSLFIPLIGTTLGSGMVFFLKKEINPKVRKILMGFASGVVEPIASLLAIGLAV